MEYILIVVLLFVAVEVLIHDNKTNHKHDDKEDL
jgi:hypothetical protein